MKPLCIYHGNCQDGFGAAWAVWSAFKGDVDFHAGVHQDQPPDVTDRDVIIVDFSYKLPILKTMGSKARSLVVLDHHKSAAEDLAGLPTLGAGPWAQTASGGTVAALFDMERSGAGIAWDYFHSGEPRPALIDHIEDRDLWRFALPATREIVAALFSYPYDFELYEKLMYEPLVTTRLATEGAAIERKHHKDVAELVKVCQREMVICGYRVPVASLPYTLTSDAGHLMAKETGAPFAACYWDTPEGRVFSLRSTDHGMDVSQVAKEYGGGGHEHAAGFRVSLEQAAAFELAGSAP